MRWPVLVVITFLLLVPGPAARAAEKFITIGTAEELGVYYPAGGAICRLVKRGISEHGIRCFVESTAGSFDNLNAIKRGEQDFGMVQSDWAYDAYKGTVTQPPNEKLRLAFALHSESFTVLVRAGSPIHAFQDLKGKSINIGPTGSSRRAQMERLMRVEGWTMKSFRESKAFKTIDQAKALCGRKVDAIVFVAGHPNGAVQEATALCPMRIIPVAGPKINNMIASSPYYHKTTIPAGMYPGTAQPVSTFGVRALLLTSAEEDDNNVYHVVKAVFDNLDNFKTLHPVFSTLDKRAMIRDDTNIPLHPGAERFYREIGLLK